MVMLIFLVLAVIQVALALYGRNVIAASAHEGARAGIELGRDPAEAELIARRSVLRAAGGLARELNVSVVARRESEVSVVHVSIQGVLDTFGPIPFPITVSTTATASGIARLP